MTPEEEIGHRSNIVTAALSWLGTPYRHQASAKGQGTDCLGLVRGVWREVVGGEPVALPPYTSGWTKGDEALLIAAKTHLRPCARDEMTAGDVLVFRMRSRGPARHCGIYIGQGRFLHAYDGRAVTGTWLSQYWEQRVAGVFAFPNFAAKGRA